jgi:hypothetical protein
MTTPSGRKVRRPEEEDWLMTFSLTLTGVLAPVSAQQDTPLSPPSTSLEIFRRMCLHRNLQTSPKTPKNAYKSFRTLGHFCKKQFKEM